MNLDVNSINSIQNLLLVDVTQGFSFLTIYAQNLLYYFAVFELIVFGLGWALYQSQQAERLFFQFIKIGLILFIVGNYTDLLDSILQSVLQVGQELSKHDIQKILLNPGLIWQYGYNYSTSLLQAASISEGFAVPLILTLLGFSILLVIGIFGIQICLQILGFYFISAFALLSLPLSVFSPLSDFFSASIKSILQAAVRLMIQMLIVSAAVSTWSTMKLLTFSTDNNLNEPLGFLFSGLLFVSASYYLPKITQEIIGKIKFNEHPPLSNPPNTHPFLTSNPAASTFHSTNHSLGRVSDELSSKSLPSSPVQMAAASIAASTSSSNPSYQQELKAGLQQLKSATQAIKSSASATHQVQNEQKKQLEQIKELKNTFMEILRERNKKAE